MTVDGRPFSSEGYERAKNILKTKYGKPMEVANAHIQNLIKLGTIHGAYPAKVHEFHNKLLTSAQALETLGKLQNVKGYVRLTWTSCLALEQILCVRMTTGRIGGLLSWWNL